jgi:plastocyanin
MKKLVPLIASLAIAPFALAACGGDDSESTSADTSADVNPSTEAVDLSAAPDGSLAYEEDSLESAPGTLTVNFTNPAPIAHDVCLEDSSGEEMGCSELIADGDTDVAEFEVEDGDYTYYCSVAGHREGGMEGTLTVK